MTGKEQVEELLQRLIIEKNAQNATWAGKLTIVEAFRRDVERATWEAAAELTQRMATHAHNSFTIADALAAKAREVA